MTRVYLDCQHCGRRLKVVEELAGRKVRCPSCMEVSEVPTLEVRAGRRAVPSEAEEQSTIDVPFDDGDLPEAPQRPQLRLELDEALRFAELVVENGRDGLVDAAEVFDALKLSGVTHGVDRAVVESLCLRLSRGEAEMHERICAAEWTAPEPPEAQGFKLILPNVAETREPIDEDELGRVDFKEINTIYTVEVGDEVALLIPGHDGRAGIRLDGTAVEIPELDEEGVQLGEGVELHEDRGVVIATRKGRPVLTDRELSVLQVYEVEGDVDFSTGNIRFEGHVVVKGSVLDDFELECKSVEVHGSVGAAKIFCETDASFAGGINGNGKCRLFIGGDCEAKYVNQVLAHIGGNLEVERGLTNSEIVCWGRLVASRVVGGKSSARLGYLIEDLGSELGVVTVVAPGLISLPSVYRQKNDGEGDTLEEQRKHEGVHTESDGSDDADSSVTREGPMVDLSNSVRQALLQRFLKPTAANDDVEIQLRERVDMVNVTSKMYADVVVCSGTRCREFVEKSAGKMSIKLDDESGNFEKHPFRRLKVTRVDG